MPYQLSAETLWQLGQKDNSANEFIEYKPREFGFNQYLTKNKNFDKSSRIFCYNLGDDKIIPRPQLPAGISSQSCNIFSPTLVNSLSLEWISDISASALLKITFSDFPVALNQGAIFFRTELPDGNIAYKEIVKTGMAIPLTVHQGTNRITFSLLPSIGLNYVFFDNICLEKVTSGIPSLPPVIESDSKVFANCFSAAEKRNMGISIYNLQNRKNILLEWRILDFNGKATKAGKEALDSSHREFTFDDLPSGYYELKLKLIDGNNQPLVLATGKDSHCVSFCIIDEAPVTRSVSSPFGAHAPRYMGYQAIAYDENTDLQFVRLARKAGVKWNRIFISWYGIESERGQYNWEYYDTIIDESAKQGICTLGVIFPLIPDWASTSQEERKGWYGMPLKRWARPDLKDYAEYVRTLVSRYKGKVQYWEVCNEPAAWPMSCYFYGTADDYAAILKTAWEAAKSADPECLILPGGMALGQVQQFFPDILKKGAAEHFDMLSVHYSSPSDIRIYRAIMQNSGVSKNIIDSENAALACQQNWTVETKDRKPGMEQQAATDLVKLYVQLLGEDVRKIFQFTFRNFLNPDNSVSPSIITYRVMTQMLEGKQFKSRKIMDSCELYFFNNAQSGDAVMVLWSTGADAKKISLPVGQASQVRLTEACGISHELNAANEVVCFSASSAPVYITGIPAETADFIIAEGITPETLLATPENQQLNLTLKIKNTFNKPLIGNLRIIGPVNWQIDLPEQAINLKPQDTLQKTIAVKMPVNVVPGVYVITADFTMERIKFSEKATVYVSSVIPGKNMLDNPGSKESDKNNKPAQWSYGMLSQSAADGKYSLQFENIPDKKWQWSIYQTPISVLTGGRYVFKAKAQGRHASLNIRMIECDGNGKKLSEQNLLRTPLTDQWEEYSGIYVAPEKVVTVKPMLVYAPTDGDALSAASINNVSFILAGLPGQQVNLAKLEFSGTATRANNGVNIDGNIDEFISSCQPLLFKPVFKGNGWQGKDDLSGRFFLKWDEQNLYLAAEITDDAHTVNDLSASERSRRGFMFDSLQFAIAPDNSDDPNNYIESTLCQTPDGPQLYREHVIITPEMPVGASDIGVVKNARSVISRKGNKTYYELSIPVFQLYPLSLKADKIIGFSILVNDNDGKGRKGYLEWSSGIGAGKNPAQYGQINLK